MTRPRAMKANGTPASGSLLCGERSGSTFARNSAAPLELGRARWAHPSSAGFASMGRAARPHPPRAATASAARTPPSEAQESPRPSRARCLSAGGRTASSLCSTALEARSRPSPPGTRRVTALSGGRSSPQSQAGQAAAYSRQPPARSSPGPLGTATKTSAPAASQVSWLWLAFSGKAAAWWARKPPSPASPPKPPPSSFAPGTGSSRCRSQGNLAVPWRRSRAHHPAASGFGPLRRWHSGWRGKAAEPLRPSG
mmetsp:Transcript_88615/g.228550  ORF Transcript_88615/g.228550 Transcript_88615/m.228550 type:complete len:254 (+) Transcript_88615:1298-2059(+)